MKQKNSISFGFRGWMLLIYQALANISFIVFINYPMNVLADLYGGAQKVSSVYTTSGIIAGLLTLILTRYIGKIKNIKRLSISLGIVAFIASCSITLIPPSSPTLWQFCFAISTIFITTYATFSIGILVGHWFPRRKGTVMGIATMVFPICSGLTGFFAQTVFSGPAPDVFGGFLPYLIIAALALVIGIIFIKDYPEQCGAYRDNDKNMTPEVAKAMMEAEIEAKKNSVWTLANTLKNRDFWFACVAMSLLLFCSTGIMSQSMLIVNSYAEELAWVGGYSGVMVCVAVVACIGSWLLGIFDTKFGTKTSLMIAISCMILAGIFGFIQNAICMFISMMFVSFFMGAGSNFTVSMSAQYWRREDFPNVFACVNPIVSILSVFGPMVMAILVTTISPKAALVAVGILGVISMVLLVLFNAKHVKVVDDTYRTAKGLPVDDELLSRK